jgi:hypothetical protein
MNPTTSLTSTNTNTPPIISTNINTSISALYPTNITMGSPHLSNTMAANIVTTIIMISRQDTCSMIPQTAQISTVGVI